MAGYELKFYSNLSVNIAHYKKKFAFYDYRYSVGLFAFALSGSCLSYYFLHWGLYERSVLQLVNAFGSSMLLAALARKFSNTVENHFTVVQTMLQDVLNNDEVSQISTNMIFCVLPMIDVILGEGISLCVNIVEFGLTINSLMTLIWTVGVSFQHHPFVYFPRIPKLTTLENA